VRLISEMIKNVANDVIPTICMFSLLIYKRHSDLKTSDKFHIEVSKVVGYCPYVLAFLDSANVLTTFCWLQ
jgi:hypothetical protein